MIKKYCQNCGKQIPKDAKFCPYCDAKQIVDANSRNADRSHGVRVNANGQLSVFHGADVPSKFNVKIITLITVMIDTIVMVLFSSSWETLAMSVRNISSAPVVIYIIFMLWTAGIEYFLGGHMSKRYNYLMLSFFGLMGIVAFAFIVAGTTQV